MLRRSSTLGFVLLVIAVAVLFVPFAAASNAGGPVQTLTVLIIVCALAAIAFAWFVLRQHGYVRTTYIAAAALVGALSSALLIGFIHEFDGVSRDVLQARFFLVASLDGIGLWLFTIAVRRIFPRRARGLAIGAIALLMIALFPGPTLLMQPGVADLNVLDIRPQMRAGFMYWTTGTMLLIAPFWALMTIPGDWFDRAWSSATAHIMAVPARSFAIGLLLATFAVALLFTWYSFDARPTTADEIAQLWHARMLLAGRLALPADPNPEFFAIDNIIDRPLWMSQFPIGGPAALAVGLFVHAVWLLNPLLTALTAFNVYRFVQRAYDEAQARAAATIFALSPMVLLMGGTHMNHMPTAWLITVALASLPVWIHSAAEAPRLRSAALIGVALGAAIAIRPLDGVVATVVIGLVMLAVASRDRARSRSLLLAVVSGAIPVFLLLVANWRTTGSPFRFGYEVLWGSNHSLGLHDDPTGHPHTPWRALVLGVKYAAQLNWITTAWPVPLMLVVASGMLLARRPPRWDLLLLALVGFQWLVYTFYWHDGQFIGPRFLFSAVPALLILAARAPFIAHQRLRGVARRIAMITIPVCIGVSWLRHMPPFGVQGLAQEFRESRSRLKLDPPVEIESGAVRHALVFVQEGAATRLLRRLWGIGVSRPDAARLLDSADGCSLLEAVRAEELSPGDDAGRVQRIESRVTPFRPSIANVHVPDQNFRVSENASLTPACRREIALDNRLRNTVAYGSMLLLNRFDGTGRIGGNAVYVMNLGERNEVLRGRFADRRWYRYEVPLSRRDTTPLLVPYDSLP
jgi:hypothetical protein